MIKLSLGLIALIVLGLGMTIILTGDNSSITGNTIVIDSEKIGSEKNIKTFFVDSSHLRFYIDGVENPEILVNEGDTVIIEFKSSEGFHDFVIDEFGAATAKINPGNVSKVEFIADKKGTFEYYCSVGKHRANGMFGKFIVQ